MPCRRPLRLLSSQAAGRAPFRPSRFPCGSKPTPGCAKRRRPSLPSLPLLASLLSLFFFLCVRGRLAAGRLDWHVLRSIWPPLGGPPELPPTAVASMLGPLGAWICTPCVAFGHSRRFDSSAAARLDLHAPRGACAPLGRALPPPTAFASLARPLRGWSCARSQHWRIPPQGRAKQTPTESLSIARPLRGRTCTPRGALAHVKRIHLVVRPWQPKPALLHVPYALPIGGVGLGTSSG